MRGETCIGVAPERAVRSAGGGTHQPGKRGRRARDRGRRDGQGTAIGQETREARTCPTGSSRPA